MLRFIDSAASVSHLAVSGDDDFAFSLTGQDRHAKLVISELNSWPNASSCRCYTPDVAIDSVRFEAKVIGYIFLVGLFHSLFQAGLSRRFPCPLFFCPLFFWLVGGSWIVLRS